MAEDKRLVLLNRFLGAFERIIYSDLPKDEKLSYAKTLYLAYCCAIDKKPNDLIVDCNGKAWEVSEDA